MNRPHRCHRCRHGGAGDPSWQGLWVSKAQSPPAATAAPHFTPTPHPQSPQSSPATIQPPPSFLLDPPRVLVPPDSRETVQSPSGRSCRDGDPEV